MVDVIYASPGATAPSERHVVVVAHRIGLPLADKGYFYDSDESDDGGAGPFDWKLTEAIERAMRFASDRGLNKVVVRARVT